MASVYSLNGTTSYLHTKTEVRILKYTRTRSLPHRSIIYKLSEAEQDPQGFTDHCTFSLLAFLHFHLAIGELFLLNSPTELKINRLFLVVQN